MNPLPPEDAFFHEASEAVRFHVLVGDVFKSASVSRHALRYRFRPNGHFDDPMEVFASHRPDIEAAAQRRFAEGALEPVMLREYDLRVTGVQGPA